MPFMVYGTRRVPATLVIYAAPLVSVATASSMIGEPGTPLMAIC